jgi:hypothetical protein
VPAAAPEKGQTMTKNAGELHPDVKEAFAAARRSLDRYEKLVSLCGPQVMLDNEERILSYRVLLIGQAVDDVDCQKHKEEGAKP